MLERVAHIICPAIPQQFLIDLLRQITLDAGPIEMEINCTWYCSNFLPVIENALPCFFLC